ncbi:hypothetical protein GCM10023322_71850 [Rugosimonospora acidiphila]|uniref:Uncharacterized protein n=1 Tax=Rugosimonospora acidiphila TaxID=556531 RepID=A0ABP9SMC9_9ACTN
MPEVPPRQGKDRPARKEQENRDSPDYEPRWQRRVDQVASYVPKGVVFSGALVTVWLDHPNKVVATGVLTAGMAAESGKVWWDRFKERGKKPRAKGAGPDADQ